VRGGQAYGIEAGSHRRSCGYSVVVLFLQKKWIESDQNEDKVNYNFLTVAAKEAEVAMRKEEGGPFGAMIVRNGVIVRNREIVNGKRCGNLLMKFGIRLC
jgi:hypothetical protein